jgi:curved DNA-binding protein CbpA
MADEFVDWYAFLGVAREATAKEVGRAYRRKALECHPDKRPGDAQAARDFERLQKCYELLADELARKAFDGVLAARELRAARAQTDGKKRAQMRADLEQRETAVRDAQRAAGGGAVATKRPRGEDAAADAAAELAAERAARGVLEKELARLREANVVRQRAAAEARAALASAAGGGAEARGVTLALRWRAGDSFSAELLTALLRSVAPPRRGSAAGIGFSVALGKRQALAHFDDAADADAVLRAWAARGGGAGDDDLAASTGITVELVGGGSGGGGGVADEGGYLPLAVPTSSAQPAPRRALAADAGSGGGGGGGGGGDDDYTEYERLTLMRLRQAGERQTAA